MPDHPASAEVEVLNPAPEDVLAPGVQPSRNYMKAVELGHVAAASGLYPEARTAARAAMVIMVGMDLGLGPAAALQGIHIMEKSDKVTFLIEGKILAALVNRHPDLGYKVLKRSEEEVEIQFLRDGEPAGPNIVWTMADAARAGLAGKPTYKSYPREMLTWRALAEGVRIYAPEVLAGQPVYVDAEFGEERGTYREALEGPKKAEPLTDPEAEALREEAETIYRELVELNPERLLRGRKTTMVRNAEHSHAALRDVVSSLADLRDTEAQIVRAKADLTSKLGEKPAKDIIARAERRGSQRERLDVLTAALLPEPDAEAQSDPEEAADGE